MRKWRGEIADQLAEIDARFGRVVEDEARAVEEVLDLRQLHRQAALADLELRDALRVLLALLLLQPLDDVVARRAPDDDLRRVGRRAGAAPATCGGVRVTVPTRRPVGAVPRRLVARRQPVDHAGRAAGTTPSARRRELDADVRGKRPSEVQRQPVGDDFRTGVAIQRVEGAVDGRERAERAVAVVRADKRLQLRLEIGVGERAFVGRAPSRPRSRISDDSASSRRDSSSRSRAAAGQRLRAVETPARIGGDGRRPAAAAPRRRALPSRPRRCRRARGRCCRRRPPRPRARPPRVIAVIADQQRPRRRRRSADRSAAAGSATAPSAAARRAGL